MSQFWRASIITGTALFLEACAFYLIITIASIGLQVPGVRFPFWLVPLALVWAFLLSFYTQTLRFSTSLRGIFGLVISVVSILVLANWNTGLGLLPAKALISGNAQTIATVVLTLAFLVLLWWRGSTMAHDDVTLDTISSSFRWGLIMLFAAVLVDTLTPARIINGFLILGFFGVGLAGLSLARFSTESSESEVMSLDWLVPIGISVGAVLALGLIISLIGMGGLDDVTRGILKTVGTIGSWVLKPILLALGYVVGWLLHLANWLSSLWGGDLSEFDRAMREIEQMRQSLQRPAEEGPPAALIAALKWGAFLIATALAGWLLFRIFHFRRFLREKAEVEETRESLFSWSRANQDLSQLLGEWWRNLVTAAEGQGRRTLQPRTPRELYHSLLALAERVGYPRQEWQTPQEHRQILVGTHGRAPALPPEPVGRIVEEFQKVYYGQGEVDEARMQQLLEDWTSLQQSASPGPGPQQGQ
jgi:hypothetical protein